MYTIGKIPKDKFQTPENQNLSLFNLFYFFQNNIVHF